MEEWNNGILCRTRRFGKRMKDYQAIIFDLGNVVFHCSLDRATEYWAQISDQDVEDLNSNLILDECHENFEKSLISPDDFRYYISQQINFELTVTQFERGWNAIYQDAINGIDGLLRNLKQSQRIIALTNTNETHANIWKEKYKKTLNHFEKVFSSHEIKTRKPEMSAFQMCINYLGLAPDKIVFLDDNPEYIEGAKKLGINGILVKSFDQMLIDLSNIGIKITL